MFLIKQQSVRKYRAWKLHARNFNKSHEHLLSVEIYCELSRIFLWLLLSGILQTPPEAGSLCGQQLRWQKSFFQEVTVSQVSCSFGRNYVRSSCQMVLPRGCHVIHLPLVFCPSPYPLDVRGQSRVWVKVVPVFLGAGAQQNHSAGSAYSSLFLRCCWGTGGPKASPWCYRAGSQRLQQEAG